MSLLSPSGVPPMAFRRQFYLGPDVPEVVAGWQQHAVDRGLHLSIHPDLPYTRVDRGEHSLVLLGFALDPRHPEWRESQILEHVLDQSGPTFESVCRAFDSIGGRWAAIFRDAQRVLVFHDAAGVRQVYHCRDENGAVRCGSSPGLLARIGGKPADDAHRLEMERVGLLNPLHTHFWPGNGSSFCGISRLLPNHVLDTRAGVAHRYWPHEPLPTIDPDTAAARGSATLRGIITAAAERYPLALSITAGLDSRLLMAASREHVDRLSFYTLKRPGMSFLTPDIRIPGRMLSDLGLSHKVIGAPSVDGGPVTAALSASHSPVHASIVNQVAAMMADPPREDGAWVTLNGNVAEVAQCRYSRIPLTAENMARNARLPGSTFAAHQFVKWLDGATVALEGSGVDPWDLLYWEQKMGGWFGSIRTEFDLVEEAVSPYNSREWLTTMLAVDPALRTAPDMSFFLRLIGDLWPALLDYPINPPDRWHRFNLRARAIVKTAMSRATPALVRRGVAG